MAVPIAIDSTLTTTFSYFKVQPRHETEKPYEILINIPNLSIPRTNYASETVQCQVTDVRGRAEAYSLDTHGFTWRQLNTSVTDFRDRAQIEKIYLQEIHDSLLQELGSTIKKIHIFDWKVGNNLFGLNSFVFPLNRSNIQY